MICKLCEEESESMICDDCAEQLKENIGIKCLRCSTIGFLPRTELNIQRFEFLIGDDFRDNLMSHQICIIPMKGCPLCVKKEVEHTQFGGFTAH